MDALRMVLLNPPVPAAIDTRFWRISLSNHTAEWSRSANIHAGPWFQQNKKPEKQQEFVPFQKSSPDRTNIEHFSGGFKKNSKISCLIISGY